MAVLGGVGDSFERGTPVWELPNACTGHVLHTSVRDIPRLGGRQSEGTVSSRMRRAGAVLALLEAAFSPAPLGENPVRTILCVGYLHSTRQI